MCWAGVGGCIHPDELFERLSERQWAGWQAWSDKFSTPLRRADINAALIRQTMMAPYLGSSKLPTVSELLPNYTYGRSMKAAKSPRQIFEAASVVMGAAAAAQSKRKAG